MAESVSSREILPFVYSVEISLAANGTGTKTLVLGADSEFELYGFEARTNIDYVGNAVPYTMSGIAQLASPAQSLAVPDCFKVLIKDISTGRDFFTTSLPRSLITGNVANFFLPEGYRIRFPRQNQLQFDFTSLVSVLPAGASNLDITFAMRGYKIFGRMG
jgi:hypothetical protein